MTDWMSSQLDTHVKTAAAIEGLLPEVRRVGHMLCSAFGDRRVLYTFGNGEAPRMPSTSQAK